MFPLEVTDRTISFDGLPKANMFGKGYQSHNPVHSEENHTSNDSPPKYLVKPYIIILHFIFFFECMVHKNNLGL